MTLFELDDLQSLLNTVPSKPIDTGVGLYRNGYRSYGSMFWGWKPAHMVNEFFKKIHCDINTLNILDLGAGNGKNSVEFLRHNVNHVTAVEIDPIACNELIKAKISLEDHRLIKENSISVLNMDAFDFIKSCQDKYDVIITYGLLHVIKNIDSLTDKIREILSKVKIGGYLIIQFITDKYPAPSSQPELANTITNKELLFHCIDKHWEKIIINEDDIIHSHKGSEAEHKHGSFRGILRRTI